MGGVYMFMCVQTYMYTGCVCGNVCVCMCAFVWKPEVNIRCHFSGTNPFIFEAESHLRLGLTDYARLAGQRAPGISRPCPSAAGIDSMWYPFGRYMDAGAQSQSLTSAWQAHLHGRYCAHGVCLSSQPCVNNIFKNPEGF